MDKKRVSESVYKHRYRFFFLAGITFGWLILGLSFIKPYTHFILNYLVWILFVPIVIISWIVLVYVRERDKDATID